jgi:hypothetical protein
MKAVAVAILTMITYLIFFVAVRRAGNFFSIPASEPITAVKPSEKIPAGRLTPATEIKSETFNECQWRSSPEDQIFLDFLAQLFTILIWFLIFKVVHRIYDNNLQRRWYRENETKQEQKKSKSVINTSVERYGDVHEEDVAGVEECPTHIWNERGSMREDEYAAYFLEEDHDAAYFQRDVNSVTPTEETLGDPASMVTLHCGQQAWADCWKEYM